MIRAYLSLILILLNCSILHVQTQDIPTRKCNFEYGVRIARSTNFFSPGALIFEEDIGIHFFDGFFVRLNKSRGSYRLGLGYFSNNSLFPYYEKPPKQVTYTGTKYIQYMAGYQYQLGKLKVFYLVSDLVYSKIKKEGYLTGTNGPLFYFDSFRKNFGIAPGFGLQKKLAKWCCISFEAQLNILRQKIRGTEKLPNGGAIYYQVEKVGMVFPYNLQLFFTLYIP